MLDQVLVTMFLLEACRLAIFLGFVKILPLIGSLWAIVGWQLLTQFTTRKLQMLPVVRNLVGWSSGIILLISFILQLCKIIIYIISLNMHILHKFICLKPFIYSVYCPLLGRKAKRNNNLTNLRINLPISALSVLIKINY